jgi:hypothetical protein
MLFVFVPVLSKKDEHEGVPVTFFGAIPTPPGQGRGEDVVKGEEEVLHCGLACPANEYGGVVAV